MTDALVIGAGLSGLAAALQLAEKGAKVTLLERRPFAGGRVYSFRDPVVDQEVDNGQHVFLACCSTFLDFVRRIGLEDAVRLQARMEIPFIDARTGRRFSLREQNPVLSFLGLKHLNPREKWRIARTVRAIRGIDPWSDPGLEHIPFARWLRARGAGEREIREFWDVFIVAALNAPSSEVAAAPSIFTIRESFSKGLEAARVGWLTRGQSAIARAAVERIRALGGIVQFNRRVITLRAGRRVEALGLADGSSRTADRYIFAVPHRVFWRILPETLQRHEFFAPIARLGSSPIVNVHLWYDRPLPDLGFTAAVGSPIQWVFNRSNLWRGLDGACLTLPLGSARRHMNGSPETILDTFDRACRDLFPQLRDARRRHGRVIREPHATFLWTPGAGPLRRPHQTPLPNLYIAGDWTDVRWPSTMEGALRSGLAAAGMV